MVNRGATKLAVCYPDIIVNGRVKYYPDRDGNLMLGSVETFSHGGFRRKGYEVDRCRVWVPERTCIHDPALDIVTYNPTTGQDVHKWGYRKVNDSPTRAPYNLEGNARGRSRARGKLYDLVRCNWDLDCMITLTLDPKRVDRTAYPDIIKALSVWLANRVRRDGLKYVVVPEYHEDGEAIHFHGLCNFDALHTTYSGVRKKGRYIYNIDDFPLGFTAAVKLGCTDADRQAVAAYVCKYITKGGKKVGGRYYLHGGKLQRPVALLRELSDDDIAQLLAAVPCRQWTVPTPMGTYTKITLDARTAQKSAGKSHSAQFTLSEESTNGGVK